MEASKPKRRTQTGMGKEGVPMKKKHVLLIGMMICCLVLMKGFAFADPNDVVFSPPVAAEQLAPLTEEEMAAAKPLIIEIAIEEGQVPEPQVYPPAAYTYPFPFTRLEVFNVKKRAYKKYPYRTIGQLFFTIPGAGDFRCTGSVVEGSWVWTAGHCTVTPDPSNPNWHTNFTFVPGARGTKQPFGVWAYDNLSVSVVGWAVQGSLCYDLGGVRFQRNAKGKSLEEKLGALGFLANASREQHWNQFGYPAAAPFDGTKLIQSQSSIGEDDPFMDCDPKPIGVGNDMTGGSSGGPWIVGFGGKGSPNSINGLNSYKYIIPDRPDAMYGPYFGDAAQNIYNYMKDNPN